MQLSTQHDRAIKQVGVRAHRLVPRAVHERLLGSGYSRTGCLRELDFARIKQIHVLPIRTPLHVRIVAHRSAQNRSMSRRQSVKVLPASGVGLG